MKRVELINFFNEQLALQHVLSMEDGVNLPAVDLAGATRAKGIRDIAVEQKELVSQIILKLSSQEQNCEEAIATYCTNYNTQKKYAEHLLTELLFIPLPENLSLDVEDSLYNICSNDTLGLIGKVPDKNQVLSVIPPEEWASTSGTVLAKQLPFFSPRSPTPTKQTAEADAKQLVFGNTELKRQNTPDEFEAVNKENIALRKENKGLRMKVHSLREQLKQLESQVEESPYAFS